MREQIAGRERAKNHGLERLASLRTGQLGQSTRVRRIKPARRTQTRSSTLGNQRLAVLSD
jgi:ribosome modulation factor